jgi:hypothetical protein
LSCFFLIFCLCDTGIYEGTLQSDVSIFILKTHVAFAANKAAMILSDLTYFRMKFYNSAVKYLLITAMKITHRNKQIAVIKFFAVKNVPPTDIISQ